MFNNQLSLLAAAIASSGAPGSSAAALGPRQQQQQQQQQQRLRRGPDPEWQAREAADTLLSAAAEMHRPGIRGQQQQQGSNQQLQQLLGRPQQQQPQAKRGRGSSRASMPPHQQQQFDGMLAALSGEVADDDLENVAQALLTSYPDLSEQLLQLQSQNSRQALQQQQQMQQQQQRQQQHKQQQLIASLLSDQQMLPPNPVQQGNASNQDLIEQLVRNLMQPDEPDDNMLEAQLMQNPGQLSALLGRQQDPQARLRAQRQLQVKQQEQDLLLQLGMAPPQQQQQFQQPQQRPQQPGLLQLLQQQHAQQRNLQAITDSFKSGSAMSDVDMDASHGYAGPQGGTRGAAAAAAAAAGAGTGASGRTSSAAAKGKRKGVGTAGSGSLDPLSPMSPATAAALDPPPEALAALAAAAQGAPSSSGLQQQQLSRRGQPQQQGFNSQGFSAPQDIYTASANLGKQGAVSGKPAAALAAAAVAAVLPDMLPEPTGLSALSGGLKGAPGGLSPQLQQLMGGAQQQQQQGGIGSPALTSSSGRFTRQQQQQRQQPRQQQQQQQRDDDDDDGDEGDDDDLLPPPGLVNMDLNPVSAGPAVSAPLAPSGPLSLRAKLGLPPLGLTGPMASALPGGLGEQGPLVQPTRTLNHHVVFVWDFDDTLVPLHGLITGRYLQASGGAHDAAPAAALGRKLQGLVVQLADQHMHFQELEDVDTVNVSDVWYLAAQYEQRRSRRMQQQQQQGAQAKPGAPKGRSHTSPARSEASPEQQQPAAKRARVDRHQPKQQQKGSSTPPPSSAEKQKAAEQSRTAGSESPKGQAKRGGRGAEQGKDKAQHKAQQGKQSDAKRPSSTGDEQRPASTPPKAADGADGGKADADAAAGGGVSTSAPADVVLRPYKVGPPPDKLQQLWDDITKVYDAGSGVLPLSKQSLRALDLLYEQVDAATSGWLRSCRKLLDSLADWQDLLVTHVVVGDSQLVPLLAKLLLARLDACFGLTQVYSAAAVPKVAAFQRVRAKYGPRARYVVLGGGFEAEAAAGLLTWPFVRVLLGDKDTAGQLPAPPPAAAAGSGSGEDKGTAGSGSSKAAADTKAAAGKRQKKGSSQGSKGGEGKSSESGSDDDDDSEGTEDEGAEGQKGGKAAAGERQVSPVGAAAVRMLPLDALGSKGHTIMDLTADKLKHLVLTMQ